MELIIGGAFQGKLAYAKKLHPDLTWADGRDCTRGELDRVGGVCHFHTFISRQVEAGADLTHLAEELYEANPSLVIVSQEVGYGVVPVDAFEREWREAVGRVSTQIAALSSRVTRVICGIGTVIKDES